MAFTPLHDRIVVGRVEEGESVRGGIVIPDSAKEKPQEAEVVAGQGYHFKTYVGESVPGGLCVGCQCGSGKRAGSGRVGVGAALWTIGIQSC